MIYDLVIIGAGPSGLALAHCCSSITDLKILVIERENQIGGCHRVNRVKHNNENIFTEHGPRVYTSSYVNFNYLLNEMNTSLKELFTPYEVQVSSLYDLILTPDFLELFKIILEFIYLALNNNHGLNISMKSYTSDNNFSKKTINLINLLCILCSGGDINKCSLNQFLQLINLQGFSTIYEPKNTTDEKLFIIWKKFLEKKGVTFMLNSEIKNINVSDNKIMSCDINDNIKIEGAKYIFAIPPKNLFELFNKSKNKLLQNSFGNFNVFKKWVNDSNYDPTISIVFHWDQKLNLEKLFTFSTSSQWGILFAVLTDYITFKESISKTVISTAITIVHVKGMNNKTANECNDKDELIQEVFNQLKYSFPNLPKPSFSVITPNSFYNNNTKEWDSKDTAYMRSYNVDYIPFQSNVIENLYTLGCQNGKSHYIFTSLECAVSNSIYLAGILYPTLKNKYDLLKAITIRDILYYIIIFIILILLIMNILYVYNNVKK